ncbi:MAG TPA: hypothetical protein DEG17_16295 [Cyanobacteria bacterium UBA11149]|nr:hypothetical protein [Cyanobacteria bacterium UBA11367]HBE60136.1 hypothetical protein [Cyanobacteria bacterium UBA11366]HBK64823.1 hypothetical protein [Cyanobacteria bacterium UBA11166]HBS72136.1 hypothetical protein [Cyanobacteria bacterium UBA11153]HBW90386.1 hypothetical protein [Cyanobacteria bacterium UBA11149]HCA93174.1 hypothetical protein [Cyanobacteria bacterium UBA9226]
MREEFRQIFPAPPPPADIFATYQITHEFYREAQVRQEFQSYCQWYRETTKLHQQELAKMQGDINLFAWFSLRR